MPRCDSRGRFIDWPIPPSAVIGDSPEADALRRKLDATWVARYMKIALPEKSPYVQQLVRSGVPFVQEDECGVSDAGPVEAAFLYPLRRVRGEPVRPPCLRKHPLVGEDRLRRDRMRAYFDAINGEPVHH